MSTPIRTMLFSCMTLVAVLQSSCVSTRPNHKNHAETNPPEPRKYSNPSAHHFEQSGARFADDLYIKAVSEFILDRPESALQHLRRLFTFEPGFEAYLLAAKCYQASVRADSALVYVQRALTINDTCAECYRVVGELQYSANNWCEAAKAFKRYTELDDRPAAKLSYASATAQCNPAQGALLLEELYNETGSYAILFELSSLYEQLGDSARIFQTVDRIISDMPGTGFPLESYADVLIRGKQFTRVLRILDTPGALRDSNQKQEVLKNLAYEMYNSPDRCDTVNAMGLYEAARRYMTDDVTMLELCGLILLEKGLKTTAQHSFEAACDADSTIGSVMRLASFFNDKSDTLNVVHFLSRDTIKAKSSYQISLLLGMMHAWLQNTSEAARWYRNAIIADDSTDEARLYLAAIYSRQGKIRESEELYEQVIRLYPDNSLALNNLAYAYATSGRNLDLALSYARRATEAEPKRASYLDTYGWVLHRKGLYTEADSVLRTAIEFDENNATFFEHLGDNSKKLGRRDRAIAAWTRAFELDKSRTYLQRRLKSR
jgi:tetratricopeptide (TPR) repeat protein